jgi:hypothetical protein
MLSKTFKTHCNFNSVKSIKYICECVTEGRFGGIFLPSHRYQRWNYQLSSCSTYELQWGDLACILIPYSRTSSHCYTFGGASGEWASILFHSVESCSTTETPPTTTLTRFLSKVSAGLGWVLSLLISGFSSAWSYGKNSISPAVVTMRPRGGKPRNEKTQRPLTSFFVTCQSDPFARTLHYSEMPGYYAWNASSKKFHRRKQGDVVPGDPDVRSTGCSWPYLYSPSKEKWMLPFAVVTGESSRANIIRITMNC